MVGGACELPPTVWRVEWPDSIRDALVSFTNPHGTITNSDLELAGAFLHVLVLEGMMEMANCNTLSGCDNTPTVSWVLKMCCSSSEVATILLKAWGSRLFHGHFNPSQLFYLPGSLNTHADFASRKFNHQTGDGTKAPITPFEFLTSFNTQFPLQNTSWRMFHLVAQSQ